MWGGRLNRAGTKVSGPTELTQALLQGAKRFSEKVIIIVVFSAVVINIHVVVGDRL